MIICDPIAWDLKKPTCSICGHLIDWGEAMEPEPPRHVSCPPSIDLKQVTP